MLVVLSDKVTNLLYHSIRNGLVDFFESLQAFEQKTTALNWILSLDETQLYQSFASFIVVLVIDLVSVSVKNLMEFAEQIVVLQIFLDLKRLDHLLFLFKQLF